MIYRFILWICLPTYVRLRCGEVTFIRNVAGMTKFNRWGRLIIPFDIGTKK